MQSSANAHAGERTVTDARFVDGPTTAAKTQNHDCVVILLLGNALDLPPYLSC